MYIGTSSLEVVCVEGGTSRNVDGEVPTECHVLEYRDSVVCDAALCLTTVETDVGCGAVDLKDLDGLKDRARSDTIGTDFECTKEASL